MIKESMQEVGCLLILIACLNSIIGQVTGSNTNQPGTDAYKNISFSIFYFGVIVFCNISYGYTISYSLY